MKGKAAVQADEQDAGKSQRAANAFAPAESLVPLKQEAEADGEQRPQLLDDGGFGPPFMAKPM